MINKLLLLILSLSFFAAYAQEQQQQQNPNVELPDFVITGKDVVNIGKAKKIGPDFISIVSEQFIKPVLPTENLALKEIQTPVKGSLDSIDSLNYLNGTLNAGVGFYSLPSAGLTFASPFPAGLIETFINGQNRRAYVDNSDRYDLNGGANLMLFIDNNSSFLPGTKVSFHGDFKTSGYKFFASDNPLNKRNYNGGSAYVGIENTLNKYFIFDAKAMDQSAFYKTENFSENVLNILGSAKLTLPYLSLGANVDFKKQFITNDFFKNGKSYSFSARPTMGIEFSKVLKTSFGFNYAKTDTDSYFSPYLAFGLNLGSGFTVFGEFTPSGEFWQASKFADMNPYFRASKFTNIFIKKNSAINVTAKYEYFTYFEIDAGFKYFQSDNLPYFADSPSKGSFDIHTTSAKNLSSFLNLLFHLGPYGIFYGTVEANNVRDAANDVVPYYPAAKAALNYGYNFDFGLYAEANLAFTSGVYTDIANSNFQKKYINLGMKLKYQLHSNLGLTLQVQNITANKNYIWNGYQEPPLDITGGVSIIF